MTYLSIPSRTIRYKRPEPSTRPSEWTLRTLPGRTIPAKVGCPDYSSWVRTGYRERYPPNYSWSPRRKSTQQTSRRPAKWQHGCSLTFYRTPWLRGARWWYRLSNTRRPCRRRNIISNTVVSGMWLFWKSTTLISPLRYVCICYLIDL